MAKRGADPNSQGSKENPWGSGPEIRYGVGCEADPEPERSPTEPERSPTPGYLNLPPEFDMAAWMRLPPVDPADIRQPEETIMCDSQADPALMASADQMATRKTVQAKSRLAKKIPAFGNSAQSQFQLCDPLSAAMEAMLIDDDCSSSSVSQNPFAQASNPLATATTQPVNFSSNLFGQSQPQQVGNNSIFGQPQPQQTNNIFGQPQSQQHSSLFGQPQPQQPSSSFGQSQSQQSNNSFGQTQQQQFGSSFGQSQSQPLGNLFGQPQLQQPKTTSNNNNNLFGQPQSQQLGSNSTGLDQPKPQLFGSSSNNNSSSFGSNNTSLFGSNHSPFGQSQPQQFSNNSNSGSTTSDVFGQLQQGRPGDISMSDESGQQLSSSNGLGTANALQDYSQKRLRKSLEFKDSGEKAVADSSVAKSPAVQPATSSAPTAPASTNATSSTPFTPTAAASSGLFGGFASAPPKAPTATASLFGGLTQGASQTPATQPAAANANASTPFSASGPLFGGSAYVQSQTPPTPAAAANTGAVAPIATPKAAPESLFGGSDAAAPPTPGTQSSAANGSNSGLATTAPSASKDLFSNVFKTQTPASSAASAGTPAFANIFQPPAQPVASSGPFGNVFKPGFSTSSQTSTGTSGKASESQQSAAQPPQFQTPSTLPAFSRETPPKASAVDTSGQESEKSNAAETSKVLSNPDNESRSSTASDFSLSALPKEAKGIPEKKTALRSRLSGLHSAFLEVMNQVGLSHPRDVSLQCQYYLDQRRIIAAMIKELSPSNGIKRTAPTTGDEGQSSKRSKTSATVGESDRARSIGGIHSDTTTAAQTPLFKPQVSSHSGTSEQVVSPATNKVGGPPKFAPPKFGAVGNDFMSSFGQQAKAAADKKRQDEEEEELDSDDDIEEFRRKKDEQEKQKQEEWKKAAVKFKMNEASSPASPQPAKSIFETQQKPSQTSPNLFGHLQKAAEDDGESDEDDEGDAPEADGPSQSTPSLFDRVSTPSLFDRSTTSDAAKEPKAKDATADHTWKPESPIKFASAATSSSGKTSNIFQAQTPFGAPASAAKPSTPAKPIFGDAPSTAPAKSLFGGLTNTTPAKSLFGGSTNTNTTPAQPLFGGAAAKAPSNTLFGGPTAVTGQSMPTPTPPVNLFAGPSFPSGATSAATTRATTRDNTPSATGEESAAESYKGSENGESNQADSNKAQLDGAEEDAQLSLSTLQPAERQANDVVFEALEANITKYDATKKTWEAKRKGTFYLLKDKASGKCRYLARTIPTGKIIINAGLLENSAEFVPRSRVKIGVAESSGSISTYLLQFKTEAVAQELVSAIKDSRSS